MNLAALNPSQSEIEDKPWKYLGYREYSNYIASDEDYLILRRFGCLHIRVLLMLQDELVELENRLAELDASLAARDYVDVHNGSFREETSETRLDTIHEIERRLRNYNELFLQHMQLRSRPAVHARNIKSVSNWHRNHGDAAIKAEEVEYLQRSKDLVSIVNKSKSPLRRFLEKSTHFRLLKVWREASDSQDENVIYTSDKRIDGFIAFITTIIGLAMLVAPLWILAFVTGIVYRLAVITIFLVVFLCFVSSMTVARPSEALGAAAA
jgi:hypothetical protein